MQVLELSPYKITAKTAYELLGSSVKHTSLKTTRFL